MPVDGRIARGDATRRMVLSRAVDVASVDGLDGLSLGRLATELELSKSGVFALFGSKEELQLATIEAALAIFGSHVVTPSRAVAPGLPRLRAACERWLAYSERRIFPGGCFFFNVGAEFDARPGRVHDAVAAASGSFAAFLREAAEEASRARPPRRGRRGAGVRAARTGPRGQRGRRPPRRNPGVRAGQAGDPGPPGQLVNYFQSTCGDR